jgi:hypothetical protein
MSSPIASSGPSAAYHPLFIEIVDEEPAKRRNIAQIIECAKFLNAWLRSGNTRVDNVQLAKVVAHTTKARQTALRLMVKK